MHTTLNIFFINCILLLYTTIHFDVGGYSLTPLGHKVLFLSLNGISIFFRELYKLSEDDEVIHYYINNSVAVDGDHMILKINKK